MKKPYNSVEPLNGTVKNSDMPESVQIFVKRAFSRAKLADFTPLQFKTLKSEIKTIISLAKEQKALNHNKWSCQMIPVLDGPGLKLDLYTNLRGEDLKKVELLKLKSTKSIVNPPKRQNIFGEESSDESETDFNVPVVKKMKLSNGNSIANLKKVKKLSQITSIESPDPEFSSNDKLAERSKRFERELKASTKDVSYDMDPLDMGPIIGTNKTLEKKYLRLTSQPRPETVRPLSVLRRTLKFLRNKYFDGATYNYLCDQCKSMRQDLTVQNIKNEFTVEVYQFHSKIAMEFGDLGEFNQCQSQLKLLYEEESLRSEDWLEFVSYRFLYYLLTDNRNEIDQLMIYLIELGEEVINNPFIKSAMTLDKILLKKNYYNFRKLLKGLNTIIEPIDELKKPMFFFFICLFNQIVKMERPRILLIVCRSYRQIGLDYLIQLLSYNEEDELIEYLKSLNIDKFIENGTFICHMAKSTMETIGSKRRIDIKGQI